MKRFLIDTSVLVESERKRFDLKSFILAQKAETFICDAGLAEFLAGEPIKDAAKLKNFREFYATLKRMTSLPLTREVCERAGGLLYKARRRGFTVPLGDALHAAVADLEGLEVLTSDADHFEAMELRALNPLKNFSA